MNFPDHFEMKGIYSIFLACCRYNYARALLLLGLDDGTGPSDEDPVLRRGAYLSFLYLRHLRIRELQVRGCWFQPSEMLGCLEVGLSFCSRSNTFLHFVLICPWNRAFLGVAFPFSAEGWTCPPPGPHSKFCSRCGQPRAKSWGCSLFQRTCLGILNYFRSVERTLTINTSGLTLVAGSLVPTTEESSWVNTAKGGLGTLQGLRAHHYVHRTPAEHKVRCSATIFSFSIILSPKPPSSRHLQSVNLME